MAKTKSATKTTAKKTANTAASKKATAKKSPKKAPAKAKKAAEAEATIDRRRKGRRTKEAAKTEAPEAEAPKAEAPKLERRKKVNRRRQIDPTTCERDYSEAEVEFMNALDDYKRKSGRMFPTCSEVLEVIRDLGYVQLSPRGVWRPAAVSRKRQLDEDAVATGRGSPGSFGEQLRAESGRARDGRVTQQGSPEA